MDDSIKSSVSIPIHSLIFDVIKRVYLNSQLEWGSGAVYLQFKLKLKKFGVTVWLASKVHDDIYFLHILLY